MGSMTCMTCLGTLCSSVVAGLDSWQTHPDLQESKEKHFVPQGAEEMKGIARRSRQRFPDLFPTKFSRADFYVRVDIVKCS